MNIIKLSRSENNQIVSLPEAYQIPGNEAYIKKIGNTIVLIPTEQPWQTLFDSLDAFSDDFMADREQPEQQSREELFE